MNKTAEKGFTLLEVMVALLVLAVALGGTLKVMENAASNSIRLTDKTFANWVAMNKLEELRIMDEWPRIGSKSTGSDEMSGRKWDWLQETIKTDDENLKRIEISVWPDKQKDEDPVVTLVGFLAKP